MEKVKAKDASLVGQIVAAVWIATWCSIKFMKQGVANIGIDDIVVSGATIAACFIPVYFSIILDKFKGKVQQLGSVVSAESSGVEEVKQ